MKIVQIIRSLKGGGAEKVVQTLAKAFVSLGHESIIITLIDQDKENIVLDGVELIYTSSKSLISMLKTINADLILAHMKTPQKILKNVYMDNLFFVIHSTQSERLKQRRFLTKILYGIRIKRLQKLFNGHKLITVSKGIADDLVNELNVVPDSLHTIYNPFDRVEIQHKSSEAVEIEKPYILHAGRLEKVKRQDMLLKAYAKSNRREDLVILGDGSQLDTLKKLVQKLHLASKVHFLGWKENPYPYIKNAELFVLSSEVEGLPTVLIESLILHTPIVSTNCKSGPEEILIGPLKNYLVEVNNVDKLAQKINEAMKNKPEIVPEYYLRFDAKEVAKEYLALTH
ncbi:MAG: glycosyltransferase [Campylobacterales bacterium]|nr:glycosyltransferase [Campylobacterales bacterium]HEO98712.1 glycosyltransferase [Campylobacterota bacterium]